MEEPEAAKSGKAIMGRTATVSVRNATAVKAVVRTENARLAHIKPGWRDIKPQKSQYPPHNYSAQCCQVYLVLEISDTAVGTQK